MRKFEVIAYQFNELSDAAKQTAIEKYRQSQWEYGDFLHFFTDNVTEQAKEEGFEDIELQYSLSCSQGDGLSFECKNFDIVKFLDENLPTGHKLLKDSLAANLVVKITGNTGNYAFAAKNQVDMYIEHNNELKNVNILVDSLRDILENKYIDFCAKMEKQGYDEIEYQQSDEAIIETIEANEYEFNEEGGRI